MPIPFASMRMPVACIGMALALSACAHSPAHPNRAPVATSLQSDAPTDFLPEGMAWDARRQRFLVGSVRHARVDAIDARDGRATRFAQAPGSVLGMRIDEATQALWITWTRFGAGFVRNNGTGIAAFSLADGRPLGDWPLPDADPRANLGELLQVGAHAFVVSDSGTGALHRFDTRTHAWSTIVPAGTFDSPQGVAPSAHAQSVILADHASGLWRIDLDSGARTALVAPATAELRGIDGLYRLGDDLVAIQNGTRTHRILRIELDADERIVRVGKLAEGDPRWDEPTLGEFVAGRFWFNARSQWSRFDDALRPRPDAVLRAPLLDSLDLDPDQAPSR
jgi:hypothetical protein